MTQDRVRSDYVVFMPCACYNSGVLHSVHVLKTLQSRTAVTQFRYGPENRIIAVSSSSSSRLKNELNVCSLETSVTTAERIHSCRSQYQWRQFSIKVKETNFQCLIVGVIRASY